MSVRRLPRWKRPDREGGESPWPGRWSLVDREPFSDHRAEEEEDALAAIIARQWLDRYGVVVRDWWRRERPAISWRSIYRELRRMEMRGEVRRGYFVRGLSGAQFAVPAAVEQLRAAAASQDGTPDLVVMLASDPANVWNLPASAQSPELIDAFARPRGARALLVTRAGRVIMTSDHAGRSVLVRGDLDAATTTAAARALIAHVAARRPRDVIVETINGEPATTSPMSSSFTAAGLRLTTSGLRYYASFG